MANEMTRDEIRDDQIWCQIPTASAQGTPLVPVRITAIGATNKSTGQGIRQVATFDEDPDTPPTLEDEGSATVLNLVNLSGGDLASGYCHAYRAGSSPEGITFWWAIQPAKFDFTEL